MIADAFLLVDQMRELGWVVMLTMTQGEIVATVARLAIYLAIQSALEGK